MKTPDERREERIAILKQISVHFERIHLLMADVLTRLELDKGNNSAILAE